MTRLFAYIDHWLMMRRWKKRLLSIDTLFLFQLEESELILDHIILALLESELERDWPTHQP